MVPISYHAYTMDGSDVTYQSIIIVEEGRTPDLDMMWVGPEISKRSVRSTFEAIALALKIMLNSGINYKNCV
jgi:hypothetical protein